ncbi:hypothetical protein F5X98DRAFT_385895 [Xylaria grammica]|nr:hypothetical protein F5X98DRAFT_385895 [Xylaria grammica]
MNQMAMVAHPDKIGELAMTASISKSQFRFIPINRSPTLSLFSRAGVSIDHPQFGEQVLEKGTAAILKTRDESIHLAVPSPLGPCAFINDAHLHELKDSLHKHKSLVKTYSREGAGIEAYVDGSDTGYTDLAAENMGVSNTLKTAGVKRHVSDQD